MSPFLMALTLSAVICFALFALAMIPVREDRATDAPLDSAQYVISTIVLFLITLTLNWPYLANFKFDLVSPQTFAVLFFNTAPAALSFAPCITLCLRYASTFVFAFFI